MPYFELRAQEPAPKVDSEPVLSASSVGALSIAAALAIAAALVWLAWPQVASSGLTASTEPTTVAVLPFAHYSTADADRLLAGRVTDSMTSALAGVPSLSVRSRTSAWQFAESRPTLALVARTLDVRFIVEGSVVAAANGLRLDARLVDAALDRKVWTHELLTTAAQIDATTREMAAAIADELARRARRAASSQP